MMTLDNVERYNVLHVSETGVYAFLNKKDYIDCNFLRLECTLGMVREVYYKNDYNKRNLVLGPHKTTPMSLFYSLSESEECPYVYSSEVCTIKHSRAKKNVEATRIANRIGFDKTVYGDVYFYLTQIHMSLDEFQAWIGIPVNQL